MRPNFMLTLWKLGWHVCEPAATLCVVQINATKIVSGLNRYAVKAGVTATCVTHRTVRSSY